MSDSLMPGQLDRLTAKLKDFNPLNKKETNKIIDFNHKATLSEEINAQIDSVLEANNQKEIPRNYLGGSRLGVECDRALQYEYFNTQKDPNKEFKGRTLRIFKRGLWIEDMMIEWLRNAGFDLKTHDNNGKQFGFSIMDGKIKGHCDGVFVGGHYVVKYPCLWECKGINQASFNKLAKNGLKSTYPTYHSQIQIYQKYFNLTENPALLTAINMNTMEIHFELVKHDEAFTEKLDNRARMIIMYCDAGELLPRHFHSKDFFKCKWCSYTERCWKE